MKKEKIGLIGPGIMGLLMGLNLIKAGYDLSVYARRESAAQPLCDQGAVFFSTPKALAENVDIIISIVSDTKDVEAVLLGENGVIQTQNPKARLVIDMSSVSATTTRAIAEKLKAKNINMLDAPVSGGDIGAKTGTLTIMVGGDKQDLQRAMPLLDVLGSTITHIGDIGAGQIAKSCNQLIVAQTMVAVSEAFHLAKSAGVDPANVREALLGGFAYSKILEVHGQRMLNENYQPGFKTHLHHKDINIVRDLLDEMQLNLAGTQLAASYLDDLMTQGLGELDSAAVHHATNKDL